MYVPMIILLTIVLPVGTAAYQYFVEHLPATFLSLLGMAYVFWAGGVRLFLAGLRQTFQPQFTAREIFEMKTDEALPVVQELGFANIAMGALCMVAVFIHGMAIGGAIVAGLYYGLAGLKHAMSETRNSNRNLAMITDILISAVLAAYVLTSVAAAR